MWCSVVPALHFIKRNRVGGSLTGTDRQGEMEEVTVSVAKLCQRDGLNGFRPLVNLFSNVLTFPQPPPSSVLLTMPGSSRDLHLPLCFLNRCFPLWFFLFFLLLQSTQLIRPPSKQIKAQAHAHELYTPYKHFSSDWYFQTIYVQTWSCCLIFISCLTRLHAETYLQNIFYLFTSCSSKWN